ncbi:MAG: hypothetical protein IPK22_23150 [Verrucomicrobiaceae bacterium]|nr:hypothetical protein [Verrucomicrobiaceae bacterium]
MADQARISNLDAIDAFRSALIVFISKTQQSLDQAQDTVKKTRGWLQTEQPQYWMAQIKLRQKKLDQANAELMSARLSEFVDSPTVQQMAVRKARYALEEAQQRLERTKTWARDYDRLISPLAKKVESLRDYLENDLTRAVAYLTEVQKILAAYAEASTPAPAPAES